MGVPTPLNNPTCSSMSWLNPTRLISRTEGRSSSATSSPCPLRSSLYSTWPQGSQEECNTYTACWLTNQRAERLAAIRLNPLPLPLTYTVHLPLLQPPHTYPWAAVRDHV